MFLGGAMEIKATLRPGQKGTRQLVRHYGDQLVCVRYRYDSQRRKRYKTVELIVDEQDWIPGVRFAPDQRVMVKVGYNEGDLREAVKKAGGFWNPERKTWILPFSAAMALGLEHRVIDESIGF